MKRNEAIQRIVWCLLRHADNPDVAVATARTLQDDLGDGHERQMTFINLLRAAGLFAKDDDGYFMRYHNRSAGMPMNESFLCLEQANYVLTFPVPTEPRMRIAYSVFSGLLMKYLYQTCNAVPTDANEGFAQLWIGNDLPDAIKIWTDFQKHGRTIESLREGVDATFKAVYELNRSKRVRIGAPKLSASLAQTPLLPILESAVQRNSQMFQKQSKLGVQVQKGKKSKLVAQRPPFKLLGVGTTISEVASTVPSRGRCLVCGSCEDLFEGAQTLIPETKKVDYEGISERQPRLCSNCAFIAYLSGVYPSSDLSIVEFPADNFLELFALYESLQGVSALVALKYINRVSSMSVLPNRYLLLSHRDSKGRMDGKAQVYLQLREQTHLLKQVHRPMRVQIEGSRPEMWSEIAPYIPIGLSHFKELPLHYETKSDRKGFAYEVIRALQAGQPYKALYVAVKYADDNRHPFERRVFTKNLKAYKTFVSEQHQALAKSLGGETVSNDIYRDIADFSDSLFDLLHPLVRREQQKSGSSVSGIARKYTDLILREFGEGMAGKFLYAVCQEADVAERSGDGWVKHNAFTKLYGGSPDTKGKTPEEVAHTWDEFRKTHPVQLEVRLRGYRCKHGKYHAVWQKFLREVQARTLALLMLNVRQSH